MSVGEYGLESVVLDCEENIPYVIPNITTNSGGQIIQIDNNNGNLPYSSKMFISPLLLISLISEGSINISLKSSLKPFPLKKVSELIFFVYLIPVEPNPPSPLLVSFNESTLSKFTNVLPIALDRTPCATLSPFCIVNVSLPWLISITFTSPL